VEANAKGTLKTWAVFWYASVFQRRGLCLHPRSSLVKNIGFDGSGTNCGGDGKDKALKFLRETAVKEFPSVLQEHTLGFQRYRDHLLGKTTDVQQASLSGKGFSAWRKLAALICPRKK
jgi:hypothetical protein